MYCWDEQVSQITERRGDQVRTGTKCIYTPKWKDLKDMPDSRGFRDKEKINLASSVECKDFYAHGVRIGVFSIEFRGIDYPYDRV